MTSPPNLPKGTGIGRWRPRCYRCERFVPLANYDVIWDDYMGGWEEGYTQCSAGKGCRSDALSTKEVRGG